MSELLKARSVFVLRNAHRIIALDKRAYNRVPLWSFVSEITGHGSGYSTQICRDLGWEPLSAASNPLPAYESVEEDIE